MKNKKIIETNEQVVNEVVEEVNDKVIIKEVKSLFTQGFTISKISELTSIDKTTIIHYIFDLKYK